MTRSVFAALSMAVALVSTTAIAAEPVVPAAAGALTREELPALIKETLLGDPEIIMQALEKLRAQKAEKAKKEAAIGLEKRKADIYDNADIPAVGASKADADLTIVEFFDYHCGYCKHFLPELAKVMDSDKKLRVLFVDFPILSEDSVQAARAAIAVNRLNKAKYFDFHTALMRESGKFDEKKLMEIAKKVGIKPETLKAEMAKPEVTAILDKNREIAGALSITGTPGLIIGKSVTPGAMSAEDLKAAIAKAREEANKPADSSTGK